MKVFPKAQLSNDYDTCSMHSRYWWLEEIDSPKLTPVIRKLKNEEKELLTMYIYEERTTREIAVAMGVTHTTISRRLEKLFRNFRGK
jgi:DNA-directed RNA polymerase specialized sigma subunit